MNIRLIACIDEANGLGINNQLLYRLKDDLKRFKTLTEGNAVVMGRKTYESLPNGPLPGRSNFVISTTSGMIPGAWLYRSVSDFLEGGSRHPDTKDRKVYVIGGGEIYSQFIQHANFLDITEVKKTKRADSFFPMIDPEIWEKEMASDYITENGVSFRYVTYKRIKPL